MAGRTRRGGRRRSGAGAKGAEAKAAGAPARADGVKPKTADAKAAGAKPAATRGQASAKPAATRGAASAPKKKSRRGRGRGGGGGKAAPRQPTLTSVPTGRAAYLETRRWLLQQHGPICAYCERLVSERVITLDHVTPRRGLTAYDRRDNLVLSCKTCNAAKADKPILAFLLGNRARVIAMYKYGQHLSQQLVEMVKDLLPERDRPPVPRAGGAGKAKPSAPRRTWAEMHPKDDDASSPYLDS